MASYLVTYLLGYLVLCGVVFLVGMGWIWSLQQQAKGTHQRAIRFHRRES